MIVRSRGQDLVVEQRGPSLSDVLTGRSRAGTQVDSRSVAGLPAAKEAVRIAAEAVAALDLKVWRGEPEERMQVKATWQARFFAGRPNEREAWSQIWEQTEACITGWNNAYWLKMPSQGGTVEAVYLVHPGAVTARWNRENGYPEYRVRLPWDDNTTGWLSPALILHFRVGHVAPAQVVSPTPIELHRDSLAAGINRAAYEGDFYQNGIGKQIAVVYPRDMGAPEAAAYAQALNDQMGGSDQRFKARVFGGGPEIETIGLSLSDMQFLESSQFSIHEIARIYGVTPSLLGASSGQDKASAPLSPEHEQDRWLRYGLSPRLRRIEQAIYADVSFFGQRDYPMFAHPGIRGDLKTEAEIEHLQIQDGSLLPDEARKRRGLPPLPGGVGMIPQIVPVGGGANPVPTPVPADEEEDGDDE